MKLFLSLLVLAVSAQASPWSGRLGLDRGSIGGIEVHDFAKEATVTGIEWDVEHINYSGTEVAEAGIYVGKRDVDAHFIVGPSLGTPMGSVATFAKNVHMFVDWPFLTAVEDYGKYVHAYFNIGWDVVAIDKAHAQPDLIGFGGVLKFGN